MGGLDRAVVRAAALVLLLSWLPSPAESADNAACELTQASIDHIIRWEVGSQGLYSRKYTTPVCPACLTTASGVTIGIGYDLGHNPPAVILDDWRDHPQRNRLPAASLLGGQRAIDATRSMQDVVTPWHLALPVFRDTSIKAYCRRTIRAYPGAVLLPHNAFGSLIGTSYNRGTSVIGPRRRELATIRNTCVPAVDAECIARQYESMPRLWAGTEVGKGLKARYLDAARLARTP